MKKALKMAENHRKILKNDEKTTKNSEKQWKNTKKHWKKHKKCMENSTEKHYISISKTNKNTA